MSEKKLTPDEIQGIHSIRDRFRAAAAAPRPTRKLAVPELGEVHVVGLTGAEWDEYEAGCVTIEGGKTRTKADRARLVRLGVVSEGGVKVFRDEDEEYLATLPNRVLGPIAAAVADLSGATGGRAEAVGKG
jgi:hypothetical protein